MVNEFGIQEVSEGQNDRILEVWDTSYVSELQQKKYIEPLVTVLHNVMFSGLVKYNASLLSDLLVGIASVPYTKEQLQAVSDNIEQFKHFWALRKDIAVISLKKKYYEMFGDAALIEENKKLLDYWFGDGINHHVLSVLSIRTKKWISSLDSGQKIVEQNIIPIPVDAIKKHTGKLISSLMGRSIEGTFDPEVKKSVIIVAPHNKGLADVALGWSVRAQHPIVSNAFMAKKEAYDHPLYGRLLQSLGAVRVDRDHPEGLTASMIENFARQESLNLVITPEGTRKQGVPRKRGFYRIAVGANVPLVMAGFDYDRKKVIISQPINLTGDPLLDEDTIKKWYEDAIPGFFCNLSLV